MPSDVTRGHLDGMLLAVLEHETRHGYELARRIAARSSGQLSVPEGSLYPALHRLERQGLVASAWSDGHGQRRRRVYRLTTRGGRAVSRARDDWRSFSRAVDAVLAAAA